tara:strand:- start:753 stop:908 length:156 start_codon:yes stop_codon:yes gene_type:complete
MRNSELWYGSDVKSYKAITMDKSMIAEAAEMLQIYLIFKSAHKRYFGTDKK